MFPAFREEVEAALAAALADLDLPTDDLGVEEPPEDVDAVLASSVAFRLAGEVGAPPPEVAADIADAVDLDGEYVGAVHTQGPYVNFTPTEAYYRETLAAARDEGWGSRPATGESVVVEHTSANPTGPVHVGRARNPVIGDAVARILELAGHDVAVHYYVNDAGRQVATLVWAYEHFDEEALPAPEREKPDYDLVRYYRAANEFLEEGDPDAVEAAEAEIQAIMQGLEAGDPGTHERVTAVVDRMLGGMQATLARLPAEFDEFVKETRFMRDAEAGGTVPEEASEETWTADVTSRLAEREEAVYEEGAWQLDLSGYDIEKKLVFQRSDGTSLYATRDIAHHEWKLREFDRAVSVFGEDHTLQSEQVRAALDLLGHDTDRIETILHSWVNLPGGEGMSTREGTGIDLDDLLDEAVARAREAVERRIDDHTRGDLSGEAVEDIAEQVGIGAVRYDIVAKQPSKAITFDWEDALDFEGQSAPYVQYAHARACGILEGGDPPAEPDAALLGDPAEHALLRKTARFPAVIEGAAADLAPHRVATYAREYADAFNRFYRECPVLDADPERRAARLALVGAARHTLANALDALGIRAPESM
ncbi:MAG: arginine--tRNA ligase [Halobacteriaceae archaeon]